MALKIISNTDEPVNESPQGETKLKANQISIDNFKGELSSVTGIQSKGMYIAKLHPISSEPETPTCNIISTHYIHIDPDKTKIKYGKGKYGNTWKKDIPFIPIEDDENEKTEAT